VNDVMFTLTRQQATRSHRYSTQKGGDRYVVVYSQKLSDRLFVGVCDWRLYDTDVTN
jgi:hypothetical protein